jgi:hypothetical protein
MSDLSLARGAVETTLASESARFVFVRDFRYDEVAELIRPRRGPLKRARLRRQERLLARAREGGRQPHTFSGVLDFAGKRCAWAREERAGMVIGTAWYRGPAGTPLTQLRCERIPDSLSPVWMVDLLGGLVEAQAGSRERVDDEDCVQFIVTAELESLDGPSVPIVVPHEGSGDQALVLFVGAEGLIRRIYLHQGPVHATLDLSDFRANLRDWSRLPTPGDLGRAP